MESSTGTEALDQYRADLDQACQEFASIDQGIEVGFVEQMEMMNVPLHHYYYPFEGCAGDYNRPYPTIVDEDGPFAYWSLNEIPPWIPEQADIEAIGQQPTVQVSDSYLHNCEVHLEQYPDQIIMTLTLNEPIDLVNITINAVPINPSKSSGPQPRFGWRG